MSQPEHDLHAAGRHHVLAHDNAAARRRAQSRIETAVFARVLDLPDAEALRLLAIAMADTLCLGTDLVDALGVELKADVAASWQPDDLFFELARDREAVSAMLTEVIGETAARGYLTDTGTKKKALIRKALAGDGRGKVKAWTPRYFRFPLQQYTQRPLTARGRCNG